jgi:hypothetical protein
MCGRFVITTAKFNRIEATLGGTFAEIRPRYSISPQSIPVIRESADGTHALVKMRWGSSRTGRRTQDSLQHLQRPLTGVPRPLPGQTCTNHKDPEPLDVETVRGYVERYEFRFPVAVAPDWQTLKRWWTSVSLIDRRGVPWAASWRPTPTTSASCARRSRRCWPRIPSRARWTAPGPAAALLAVDVHG